MLGLLYVYMTMGSHSDTYNATMMVPSMIIRFASFYFVEVFCSLSCCWFVGRKKPDFSRTSKIVLITIDKIVEINMNKQTYYR